MKTILIFLTIFTSTIVVAHDGDEITGFSTERSCSYSVFNLRREALQDAIGRLNNLECSNDLINTGLKLEVLSSFEYTEEKDGECVIHSQVTIEGVCE